MSLRQLRLVSIVAAVILLLLLAALSVLARLGRSQERTPTSGVPAPLAIGTALPRPRPVPPVELVDQNGRPFSLAAWRGKWVVLAPSLTLCHEVCPMTTGALTQLTAQLRREGLAGQVAVAEVTVDPWRDTPARLRAYRRLSGANFTLLTGTQSEIKRFWSFFGVYYARVPQGKPADVDWMTGKPETFDVDHTDGVFFLDPAGQERIVEQGMPSVGGRLPAALRNLLGQEGRHNLAAPQLPWTSEEVLDDLYFLMNKDVPAGSALSGTAPSRAAVQRALAGSPGTLAAIHQQAGQLLGAAPELTNRLHALRGFPVVLNAWASWCGPCRGEFGLFASAAARYGRHVAFLGIDTNDGPGSARAFLAQHPVSYPSYQASSADLLKLAVIQGLPTTIFVNRAGRVAGVHAGQYESQASLDNDVERYALGRNG